MVRESQKQTNKIFCLIANKTFQSKNEPQFPHHKHQKQPAKRTRPPLPFTHVHTNGIEASGITVSGPYKATIIIAVATQYVHMGQQVVRKEGRVSMCLKFSNDTSSNTNCRWLPASKLSPS